MNEDKGFLVDTSVLSAFAPGQLDVNKETARWMKIQGEAGRLYLSVITVSEIWRALRKLQRSGRGDRADALAQWLGDLVRHTMTAFYRLKPMWLGPPATSKMKQSRKESTPALPMF